MPGATGTAIEAPPADLCATINTVMRDPPGIDLMPVFRFMALKAKRDPIAHIKTQIGKINKRLDMVSLQPSPLLTTAARVIIPFKNRVTPEFKIVPHPCPVINEAFTPLPIPGVLTAIMNGLKFSITRTRTELRIVVSPIRERFAALRTRFNLRGIANRPTCTAAVFSGLIAVSFDLKRLATKKAGFCNSITGGHHV